MFDKFSSASRQLVVLAQHEARQIGHAYLGTEHLLLGLLARGDRLAQGLEAAGAGYDEVRQAVVELGVITSSTNGNLPFTPNAKRVFEYALRVALGRGDRVITTGHIALGMLRVADSNGALLIAEATGSLDEVAAMFEASIDEANTADND